MIDMIANTETGIPFEIKARQTFALIGSMGIDAFAVDARSRLALVDICKQDTQNDMYKVTRSSLSFPCSNKATEMNTHTE